ncbi:uncharacterized protein AB675_4452 [Cyphellophora attinorum]|uniref:Uncharacterized protein n=1 Tax=Cyphellophora attinorum TaxID=1664694 RepID=A0A0N0NLD3_9EURO|nr:uncharacterized protein AB675_4452 [Phialophora attinorum]KPI39161.1 hypothetical protein AB675_4452 [Phialophora attinorum]
MPSWKRIRLQTAEDLEQSFDLITSYIHRPSLASTVEELSFDRIRNYIRFDDPSNPPPLCGGGRTTDYSAMVSLRLNSPLSPSEVLLNRSVHALPMPDSQKQRVSTAILWKSQNRAPDPTDRREVSNYVYYRHDEHYEYASAVFVLLCLLAPNLQQISTIPPADLPSEFLRAANRGKLAQGSSVLSKLSRVKIFTSTHRHIVNDPRFYHRTPVLSSFRHFDRFPNLKSLSTQAIEPWEDDDLSTIPPGLSTVKNISVTNSGMDSEFMGTLIRMPAELESITLTTGGRSVERGHTFIQYPKTLGKCLEQQRETLKYIDLDFDQYLRAYKFEPPEVEAELGAEPRYDHFDDSDKQDELEEDAQADLDLVADKAESLRRGHVLHSRDLPNTKSYGLTIGSFRDFHGLKVLRIGIKALLGPVYYRRDLPSGEIKTNAEGEKEVMKTWNLGLADMLPGGLEELAVRGYKTGENALWDKEVDNLKQVIREGGFPYLRTVKGLDGGNGGHEEGSVGSGEDVNDPDNNEDDLTVVEEEQGWVEAES